MISNTKKIHKQARPDLQVDVVDANLTNVNNRVATLKLTGVYGTAQRRNNV